MNATGWMDSALCTQIGPDLFQSDEPADIAEAKRICSRCPVLHACTTYSLTRRVAGVSAGLSEDERHRLITCKIAS